jgi:CcmD family protein
MIVMKYLKILLSIFILSIASGLAQAQSDVEMADVMRSNGKIYVVVATLSVVLLGILLYVIVLDRRISKLEHEIKE